MKHEDICKIEEQIKNDKLAFYKNITPADLLFKIKDWPEKPHFSRRAKFLEKAYNKCFNENGDLLIEQLDFYFEDNFLSLIVTVEILKTIKKSYDEDILYFMLYKNDNKLTYLDVLMLLNDPMGMIKDALKFKHRPSIVVHKSILTKNIVDCL